MWTSLKKTLVAAASLSLIGSYASPLPSSSSSLAARADDTYVGYGFYYFIGNGPGQEQIFAAVSTNNTPTSWDLVNKGNPILVSTVGTQGVRDPSIVRSPDGTTFYLLATDLNIGSGTSFGEASQRGSRSIVVWESSDLATWSEPRLVEVIGAEGGSAWAPEALYNPSTGEYDVYFSARLYAEDDPNHDADSYYRIMRSSTKDFTSFSAAQVYVDRQGDSVLDLTFLNTTNALYRFIKNEQPTSDPFPLTVYQEVSSDGTVDGTWTKVTENIGAGVVQSTEGPTAFVDNRDPTKAWLYVDEYNDRGYVAFSSKNAAAGEWTLDESASEPSNHARHGTIIPLNQQQYDVLRAQV